MARATLLTGPDADPQAGARTTAAGAPTNELGTLGYGGAVSPWASIVDDREYAPDLLWPRSIQVFSMMRNDAQVEGLLRACTLPIRRFRWELDPNGARPEVVDAISADLGLPVQGQPDTPQPPRRGRFIHDEHLLHVLLALAYGHMYCEMVGEVRDDGLWHLTKLAPRMPWTLAQIAVEPDGGLAYITQNTVARPMMAMPQIPVQRLVAYVWDKEGANWHGRSMLRACYRNWRIKDRLLRVDAINHERAGGVPWIEAPPNASKPQLDQLGEMAQAFKQGDNAGGAVPNGATLNLAGIKGTAGQGVVDSVRFHNEEMAQAFLAMFMKLGQTATGSRALGGTFVDFFALAQEAIADWYVGTFNEHVIEDWVDWNFGVDEQPPLLRYERDDPEYAAQDLAFMIDRGVVTVDDDLENAVRRSMGLPDRDPSQGARTPPTAAPQTPGVPSP